MSSLESWTLSYLVNSVWQIPVLFVAGWIAARTLRRVGAAAEHRVWVAVLLLQVLLPAGSVLSSGWLPSLSSVLPRAADANVTVATGPSVVPSSIHLPGWVLLAVTAGYFAVVLWFALRFLWRCSRLTGIGQEAVPALLSDEMERCRAECAARFGIGFVEVLTSSRVFSPVTMGPAPQGYRAARRHHQRHGCRGFPDHPRSRIRPHPPPRLPPQSDLRSSRAPRQLSPAAGAHPRTAYGNPRDRLRSDGG